MCIRDRAFTKEKYEKAFSSYFFTDITEEFLLDFAFWLKERGIRNGNKAGLTPVSYTHLDVYKRQVC